LKITEVRTHPCGYVEREPWERIRNFAIIEVHTDKKDLIGIGESSDCYGHSYPRVIATIVEDVLKRHLIGEDPRDVEKLLRKMSASYQHFGHGGPIVQAISGVEIALWDIIAKEANSPLYKILGGARDRIKVYAGGPLDFTHSPEESVGFYVSLVERGLKAVKIRIGNNLEWDKEFVKKTREAVGDKVKIMVDGFLNFTPAAAIRVSKMLARYNIFYFEEPILQVFDLTTLREVRQKSEVPIAVGEHIYLADGFKSVIEARAADYLTPDVTVCGGISECRKIFGLAESAGMPIVQHCGGLTAIGIAANLQALCSQNEGTFMEYDSKAFQPLRDELPQEPIFSMDNLVDGAAIVPKGSGIGITIRKNVIEKYPPVNLPVQKTMPTYGMGLIE